MARRLTTLTHQIRRAFAEMDYAQRRMFEIRAGLPPAQDIDRARDKAMIAELEAHWRA